MERKREGEQMGGKQSGTRLKSESTISEVEHSRIGVCERVAVVDGRAQATTTTIQHSGVKLLFIQHAWSMFTITMWQRSAFVFFLLVSRTLWFSFHLGPFDENKIQPVCYIIMFLSASRLFLFPALAVCLARADLAETETRVVNIVN